MFIVALSTLGCQKYHLLLHEHTQPPGNVPPASPDFCSTTPIGYELLEEMSKEMLKGWLL